jgi:murein DD-endopeptidase MepM/ murein hydrolase activator NlpD
MRGSERASLWYDLLRNLKRSRALFERSFWSQIFRQPQNEVTLVWISKGQSEVHKMRLAPRTQRLLKIGATVAVAIFIFSFIFLFEFLINWPQRAGLRDENIALKKEMQKIQFHLDTLQSSIDRMGRFDQKLRALTEIDKDFAKLKGPQGQGGGEADENGQQTTYDFGDYKILSSGLEADPDANQVLDRRQSFLVQKIYSWMRRLYKDSELQEQSFEELFEVLKGREIQLASTPSIVPVKGWVTSHFGYRIDPFTGRRGLHRGMDVAAREQAPVYSPADGVVTFTGANGSYGDTVMIFHGYGISTLYAHLSGASVKPGQKIKRGEVIASVGNSGRSTGAHLHYEVIVHGVPVDPRKFVLDRSL